jgi:hypothetical protein
MGLDMYCYAVPESAVSENDTDVKIPEQIKREDIHYWRKHHDLHGWMRDLYYNKGGTDDSFNCVNVRLYDEDLDQLKKDLLENKLPKTEGFFFGNNPPDDETLAEDMIFIVKAREAIARNMAVFYDSWW